MNERIIAALEARKKDQTEGWVFPSDSKPGHLTTVTTAFETARANAGLSSESKLYRASYTFAAKILVKTGNLSLVMRTLGHSNAHTAMICQHRNMGERNPNIEAYVWP